MSMQMTPDEFRGWEPRQPLRIDLADGCPGPRLTKVFAVTIRNKNTWTAYLACGWPLSPPGATITGLARLST